MDTEDLGELDVRDLASRAELLQRCDQRFGWIDDDGKHVISAIEAVGWHTLGVKPAPCPICEGTAFRLPTEAEVRAAIRAAGWPVVKATYHNVAAGEEVVHLEACKPSYEESVIERGGLRAHLALYLAVRA